MTPLPAVAFAVLPVSAMPGKAKRVALLTSAGRRLRRAPASFEGPFPRGVALGEASGQSVGPLLSLHRLMCQGKDEGREIMKGDIRVRGFKLFGAGVVSVLAMMLVVLPASGAFAKNTLALTVHGSPATKGSVAYIAVVVEGCSTYGGGELAENYPEAKDIAKASSVAFSECENAGESISGIASEAEVKKKAHGDSLQLKRGALDVTLPTGCEYEFSKLKGEFSGGFTVASGTQKTAKKKAGPSTCANKLTNVPYELALLDEETEPFSTTVE